MSDKGAVGADLYIEDSPDNIRKLRADGHPTIVFTNSTNRGIAGPRAEDWEQVTELVIEQLTSWKAKHGDRGELAGQ